MPSAAIHETRSPCLMAVLVERVGELLVNIQRNLLRPGVWHSAKSIPSGSIHARAFKQAMEGRPGFVIAPWCGAADCEAQIKADTQATIRNMPLDAAPVRGPCIRCHAPAEQEAWFAKSY